jgi:hydroxypyruvate reductase/glycerate 2-kinase
MDQRLRSYIKNLTALSHHGNQTLREAAADIIENALAAADPYTRVMDMVKLKGDDLWIENRCFDLATFKNIYVIGAGKATARIVEALEDVLGDRINGGVVVLKHGATANINRVEVFYGAHPIPDEAGFRGARAMMDLANRCTVDDLVIAGISGGSSALLPYPVSGVTLEEKSAVHKVLLWCGADIFEINSVRKHLSMIKGGRLAKAILPATIVNITVSDVVGDALDYITGPTVPDTSTFEDSRRVISHYKIGDELPSSARRYIENGDETQETPKDFGDAPIFTYVAVDSSVACTAAARQAEEIGFESMLLTTMLKGEAKDIGLMFANVAREIVQFDRPVSRPCAVIAGGENTVTIENHQGKGGPNQVFALAAAQEIAGLENVVIVSIDTDGTDGPTEFAGGMVDGSTLPRAIAKNLDVATAIKKHDVSSVLAELGDAIITGHTGTNINDLKFILVE